MMERIVARSLQIIGAFLAIAFIGHLCAHRIWSTFFRDDGTASFAWLWLCVSCVVGGVVVACATILSPEPTMTAWQRIAQCGACALLLCCGIVLMPLCVFLDVVRLCLP